MKTRLRWLGLGIIGIIAVGCGSSITSESPVASAQASFSPSLNRLGPDRAREALLEPTSNAHARIEEASTGLEAMQRVHDDGRLQLDWGTAR